MIDQDRFKEILFTVLPVLIACFFTITLTLVCENRLVIALVQIPAWVAVLWWTYALRTYYYKQLFGN